MQTVYATPMPGRQARRTLQPIRRNSRLAGHCEGTFWTRFDKSDVPKILRLAQEYDERARPKGARSGPLGELGLRVLREMLRMMDFKTGRLDPSLEYIAQRIKRARSAVVRALARLKDEGFLEWMRRYEPTENEGRGPQVKQTSNAYRVSLSQKAVAFLGRFARPAPIPVDFEEGKRAMAERLREYARQQQAIDIPAIARAEAKIREQLIEQERGSSVGSESRSHVYFKGK